MILNIPKIYIYLYTLYLRYVTSSRLGKEVDVEPQIQRDANAYRQPYAGYTQPYLHLYHDM